MPQRIINSTRKSLFFGFFMPSNILKKKNLTQNEKLILAFIMSITKKNAYFNASNGYIEKNFGMSKATVTKSIATLEKHEFIFRRSFNGRERKYAQTEKLKFLRREHDTLSSSVINNSMLHQII